MGSGMFLPARPPGRPAKMSKEQHGQVQSIVHGVRLRLRLLPTVDQLRLVSEGRYFRAPCSASRYPDAATKVHRRAALWRPVSRALRRAAVLDLRAIVVGCDCFFRVSIDRRSAPVALAGSRTARPAVAQRYISIDDGVPAGRQVG